MGSFSPASLAFRKTSGSSAAYAITRFSSLDRATHAPFGTSASNLDTSLTAITAYLLSRPQKEHPFARYYNNFSTNCTANNGLTEIISYEGIYLRKMLLEDTANSTPG